MPKIDINLNDMTLYGNSNAEDGPLELFLSYAVRRNELQDIVSDVSYYILMALKGHGKSALFRLAKDDLNKSSKTVIEKVGLDLAPKIQSSSSDEWVNGWKENIFIAIAEEIGLSANKFFDADATQLREIAKLSGKRQLNFLETFKQMLPTIKLSLKAPVTGGEVALSAEQKNSQIKHCSSKIENMIERYLAQDEKYIYLSMILTITL